MLRFFRLGDGGLAVFNGGGEADVRMVNALLGHTQTQSRPYSYAPHSGYQRLAAGRTIVLLDAGKSPPGAFSSEAHAGCLAFEMSAGAQRIVVNCGIAPGQDAKWGTALRATAAHSTLTLADTSSAFVLPEGWLRDRLGARLIGGPGHVETSRTENAQGQWVEARHDGYLRPFGIVHERRFGLSPKGLVLTGADRLTPASGRRRWHERGLGFAIRFHIHPDVRLSLAQDGDSVLLKLPNGEGWRFRCGGGKLGIEESIYLGGGAVRRTEQLVVSGRVHHEPMECAWLFEQVGAA